MKKIALLICIVFLGIVMQRCAPSRMVKPLEEKQHAVTASFGGPLIGFAGAVIPIPYTSVGYGYGLRANTTAFANAHTTALLFGVIQTDIGVCHNFKTFNNGLSISGNAVANVMFDKWEKNFRFFPELDANVYKPFGSKGSFWYGGFDTWFDLTKYRAHEVPQPIHIFLNPHAGVQLHHGQHWAYQLEAKALIPYIRNTPNQVDYKGFGNYGAIGIYFGITRTFGKSTILATASR